MVEQLYTAFAREASEGLPPTLATAALDQVFRPGVSFRLQLQVALFVGAAEEERNDVVDHKVTAWTGRRVLLEELPHGSGITLFSKSRRCQQHRNNKVT
jgi:hypothetical protein